MVGVPVIGPKSHGFKPRRGDGFLGVIKFRITPSSFGWGKKACDPMSFDFMEYKNHLQV
jgi:hypothetical protein